MDLWKERLSEVRPKDHLVELYDSDASLASRVSHYLREGLESDEAVIAIASVSHREAIRARLREESVDVDRAVDRGQLLLLEAEETLSRFMVDGQPDPGRFQETVGGVLDEVGERGRFQGLRAYGEMVDILWGRGNFSAAIRLEQLWDRLLHDREFPLLCAYRMGVLNPSFDAESFQSVLAVHTDRVPVGGEVLLEKALDRAMEDLLGKEDADALRPLIAAAQHVRGALCPAEAAVMWFSKALAARCDEILTRARLHYAALCAGGEPT